MKNLSLILNIVLLLAVAILYFLFFNQKPAAGETAGPASSGAAPNIVYINSDTLLSNYGYFRTRQEALAQKEQTAEAGLQSRGRELEREIAQAQERAQSGLLAPKDIQQMQQQLGLKQQQLLQDQERITQELLLETQELQMELQKKVQDLLAEIQAEKGYDYILNYGPGTGVLMVNDSLDITRMVLEHLNKQDEQK